MSKRTERIQRVQEVRRSNAATPHRNRKRYRRRQAQHDTAVRVADALRNR